jgi:hypothetical protein
MSKYEGHTPGPWSAERSADASGKAFDVLAADNSEYADEGDLTIIAGYCTEANAKLIADAPMLAEQNEKMLAMLKRLYDKNLLYDNGFEEVHNLIAEIEGEK